MSIARLLAIAGAVVAAVFFILANGSDTEWGLASFAIAFGIFLLEGVIPATWGWPRRTQ